MSEKEQLKPFLTKVLSGAGYVSTPGTPESIAGKCAYLYQEIGKYYTNVDTTALYWAILTRAKPGLLASPNASACVNDYITSFQELGLPPINLTGGVS